MEILKRIKNKGILKIIMFIIVTPMYKMSKAILNIILKKLPIKENYILFTSNPDFSDNAKVLYNYYRSRKEYDGYKYIWLISRESNIKKYKEENTVFVKSNSYFHRGKNLKALYFISRCKLIFFTHSSPFDSIAKKEGQLIINLWHGCGYKDTQKKKKTYIEKYPFDYALVPGKVFVETKSKFWGCKKEQIWDIGYPRYDLFFQDNKSTVDYINKIKKDNKIVMWMPTFRNTGNDYYPEERVERKYDLPLLKSDDELVRLNELCRNNNVVLCIKRHPMQLKYQCEDIELSNIFFLSNESLESESVDLYSLLKYTDGLITDYSSIAIDYLLLDKPMAFALDDFDTYAETRGFVFDDPKKYMPGHHVYNYEDFAKYIEDVAKGIDTYKANREDIIKDVHNICNNYCERIFDKVLELLGKNIK